jgi:hypothetical protein
VAREYRSDPGTARGLQHLSNRVHDAITVRNLTADADLHVVDDERQMRRVQEIRHSCCYIHALE